MDHFRIYNNLHIVVAEGTDKAECCAKARLVDDGHLVGEGVRPCLPLFGSLSFRPMKELRSKPMKIWFHIQLAIARVLAWFGRDRMLYDMACEEEANEHYQRIEEFLDCPEHRGVPLEELFDEMKGDSDEP